jgi:glycosyltransferase involved in cell wall biosynthesis
LKLLYITNGINGSGGLERVLSIKASYLAEKSEYEVVILSINDAHLNPFYTFSNKIKMQSIPVFGNPFSYFKLYRNGIKSIISIEKPDIILVCDDGLKAFFVPKILSSFSIPILYERHVSKEIEMKASFSFLKKRAIKFKWALMEKLATNFDKFIVLTNSNKNEWKSLKNIEVIPNPLSFYSEKSSSLKNKKIIAVGKQSYQKGYDRLIEAWKLVVQKHDDWKLEIFGKFDPKLQFQQQVNNLNISDSVFFYPPTNAIEDKFLESSIFVLSSRYEGFGMVVIEAMACGLPCVSFNCNYGPSDIIEHKIDGLLVENGDIKGLANAMIQLIESEELRFEMGKNAKINVKRFFVEEIIVKWENLFKSVVK